jgi:hypothetical protein
MVDAIALDEVPRMPIDPAERNARSLINILAQYSNGITCEDLNQEFQRVTKLRHASFYNALKLCRQMGWVTGGGGQDELYFLDPSGSWKQPPPSVGEVLEQNRREKAGLECLLSSQAGEIQDLRDEVRDLRDWSSGGGSNAVTHLVNVLTDREATTRQKIKAASIILGYRADPDVAAFTRRYLEDVCGNIDIAVDYRLQASELLRRCEAPRIMSAIERPDLTPVRYDTAEEIAERSAQHREHIERQAEINARELAEEQQRYANQRSRST